MKKILTFTVGLLVCCYVSMLISIPIHAQSVNLSISPPVIEVLLAPNKSLTQTFTLQTQGENLTATPEIHLVKPTDASGHVEIDPAPLNPSSIPLTITSQGHPLDTPFPLTGDSTPLTLTLAAANSDISQDVYLALVFKVASSDSPLSEQSQTTPAISALILTTINSTGVIPINLDLQNFSPPLVHDSWLPLTITPTIENHVSTMIRPEGKYEIISPTDKTVFSLPLYPNLVLGNSSRLLQGTEPCDLQGSVPCKPIPLSWSPTWSNIGPYRLRLTITTLGGTKITQVEKVLWFLPIRATIILASIILLILAMYLHSRLKTKTTT